MYAGLLWSLWAWTVKSRDLIGYNVVTISRPTRMRTGKHVYRLTLSFANVVNLQATEVV